jgi:CRISPR system Cascade subunit CasD
MAVRIDSPGVLLRDYHTVQVPPSKKGKQKMSFPTRKAELSVLKDDLNTVLSTRDYRCDAFYTICLWSRTSTPPYPLNELKIHLESPVFQLYLGRKSCPLSLPLHPHIVHADSMSDAFSKAGLPDNQFLNDLNLSGDVRIYWEDDDNTGYEIIHTVQRRDNPLSRRRWQFGNRTERYTMIQKNPGRG